MADALPLVYRFFIVESSSFICIRVDESAPFEALLPPLASFIRVVTAGEPLLY